MRGGNGTSTFRIKNPQVATIDTFRSASNVESQESCIQPVLSDTASTRPVLCCSPLLSRQNNHKDTDYRYKYARERARNEQQIPAIHVQPLIESLHLAKAITGCKEP